jgi:hypothetical protein
MIGKNTAFAVAAALALFAAPVARAEDAKDFFTLEYVKEVATELGATNFEESKTEKAQLVKFEIGGMPIIVGLDLCKEVPGCQGALLASAFKTGEQRYSLESLNAYNRTHPFAASIMFDNGTIAIGHAMYALGGITRDNFKANMAMFALLVPKFVEYMRAQLVASNGQGSVMRQVGYGPGDLRPVLLTPDQMRAFTSDWQALQKRR